jgi:hypothetical protein
VKEERWSGDSGGRRAKLREGRREREEGPLYLSLLPLSVLLIPLLCSLPLYPSISSSHIYPPISLPLPPSTPHPFLSPSLNPSNLSNSLLSLFPLTSRHITCYKSTFFKLDETARARHRSRHFSKSTHTSKLTKHYRLNMLNAFLKNLYYCVGIRQENMLFNVS